MSATPISTDSPQRVFISYRREDSAAYAGRIYDAMVARFGESNVFMDVEMAPGVDFVARIDEVVSGCAALIVVIGPRWTELNGDDGTPRLHDPDDFVRQEVCAAIQRSDVTVIPALVNKAPMPRAEQLPAEMHPLTRRNALELSDARWRYDVGRLTATLDELLDGYTGFGTQRPAEPATPPPPPARPEGPAPSLSPVQWLVEGAAVAAVAGFLGRLLADQIPKLGSGGDASQIANPVLRQTLTWALVGAALALWLGARNRRTDFAYLGLLGLLVGALAGAIGTLAWAIPVDPPVDLSNAADVESGENWTVANIAITGALLGALIGALWRRPHLVAGLAAGLLAGALIQVILNGGEWNTTSMPGIAFVFAVRAAAIAAAAIGATLLLSRRKPST